MRSPGLTLLLLASIVGALTLTLLAAHPDPLTPRLTTSTDLPAVTDLTATGTAGLEPSEWALGASPGGDAPYGTTPDTAPGGPTAFADEILTTPMLTHPDFVAEVGRWVSFWETAPSEWFPDYLDRMTWFEEIVDTTLAARGLPWSLRYLPVIESGYSPSAVSSARAVGMWQFMAHTARDFDIEVSTFVDDRRDPFVSTAAAADYLLRLRADFGSWFLALAAYNAGPDRIRGIIRRHAPGAEPSDALYWALRPFLPKETADFVPNLFGAIVVASDPESHGYAVPESRPFTFDRVPVLGRVSFDAAARATGATRGEIARLNPEYLQGVTPGGVVVDLRLPPGSGEEFRAYFADREEPDPAGG